MQAVIYRMDKKQGFFYSTGKYIQYPVINQNGNECLRSIYVCVCVCVCVYIYIYIYIYGQ